MKTILFTWHLLFVMMLLSVPGCGLSEDRAEEASHEGDAATPQSSDDVWAAFRNEAEPGEARWIDAARPFIQAIVERRYADAYAQLSSHATARMSRNQFIEPQDDEEYRRHDTAALQDVTLQQFEEFLALVEELFGPPRMLGNVYVESADPVVLSGKGDALDTMFALGNIPDSVPADVRQASVRCEIMCQITEAILQRLAEQEGVSVEEIREAVDEEEAYFKIKLVLVDEGGTSKVGYFEFLAPSMLD